MKALTSAFAVAGESGLRLAARVDCDQISLNVADATAQQSREASAPCPGSVESPARASIPPPRPRRPNPKRVWSRRDNNALLRLVDPTPVLFPQPREPGDRLPSVSPGRQPVETNCGQFQSTPGPAQGLHQGRAETPRDFSAGQLRHPYSITPGPAGKRRKRPCSITRARARSF